MAFEGGLCVIEEFLFSYTGLIFFFTFLPVSFQMKNNDDMWL